MIRQVFTEIADAIRTKNGSSDTYTPLEMPQAIEDIPTGGGEIDALLDGSITSLTSDVAAILDYSCYYREMLETVSLNEAVTIGAYAFNGCMSMTSFEAPKAETLKNYCLSSCNSLEEIHLPAAYAIKNSVFYGCNILETVDLQYDGEQRVAIGMNAFTQCLALKNLIVRNTHNTATLSGGSSALSSTPIASGGGYIYVPRAMVSAYQAATNWSYYSAQIRALEDYTDDGTTSGIFIPPAN